MGSYFYAFNALPVIGYLFYTIPSRLFRVQETVPLNMYTCEQMLYCLHSLHILNTSHIFHLMRMQNITTMYSTVCLTLMFFFVKNHRSHTNTYTHTYTHIYVKFPNAIESSLHNNKKCDCYTRNLINCLQTKTTVLANNQTKFVQL